MCACVCVRGVKLSRHAVRTARNECLFLFRYWGQLITALATRVGFIYSGFFSSFPVSKICSNFITNIASGARKGRLISASISLIASGIIEGNIIDFWSAACIKLQWRDAAACAILLCYYLPLQSPGRSPRASRWGGERDVISVIASSPLIAFGAPLYTPPPFKLPRVIPPSPLQYVVIKVHGLNIKTLTTEGNNTAVSNT